VVCQKSGAAATLLAALGWSVGREAKEEERLRKAAA